MTATITVNLAGMTPGPCPYCLDRYGVRAVAVGNIGIPLCEICGRGFRGREEDLLAYWEVYLATDPLNANFVFHYWMPVKRALRRLAPWKWWRWIWR